MKIVWSIICLQYFGSINKMNLKKQQERKGHHLSAIVEVSTKASKAANSTKEIIYFMYWRLLLCTVWMGQDKQSNVTNKTTGLRALPSVTV